MYHILGGSDKLTHVLDLSLVDYMVAYFGLTNLTLLTPT